MPRKEKIQLNEEQERVVCDMEKYIDCHNVLLLHGETGSGKTEVYMRIIEEKIKNGGQALILLPEILLTSQLLEKICNRSGKKVASWNSSLSISQRNRNWLGVINGDIDIIIGSRSALFLPFRDLKIIIVDEEHDSSFKQETNVIYNARDMAVSRGYYEDIPVIFSSATPSIESVYNVKIGRYKRFLLKGRFFGVNYPEVRSVDMRKEEKGFISSKLREAIKEILRNKKQSLIFVNKKGYSSTTLCKKCGYIFECNKCSAKLTQYKKDKSLVCNYCGFKINQIPQICEKCDGKIINWGPGIEKVAEEIKGYFPNAIVTQITSQTKNDAIEEIKNGDTDIIVGTQIIAKGHNFPNLMLVGIIDGDFKGFGYDLRVSERANQLLSQVIGRAGRTTEGGVGIIQTYNPEKKLHLCDEKFYEQEIELRRKNAMPPFCNIVCITISNTEEIVAKLSSIEIKGEIERHQIEVMGPAQAVIFKLNNRYRYRIILKSDKYMELQNILSKLETKKYEKQKTRIVIDVDPYHFD